MPTISTVESRILNNHRILKLLHLYLPRACHKRQWLLQTGRLPPAITYCVCTRPRCTKRSICNNMHSVIFTLYYHLRNTIIYSECFCVILRTQLGEQLCIEKQEEQDFSKIPLYKNDGLNIRNSHF